MSDKKLSELDSNPNLSEDDLLYVVDDASGDPESYKTTVGDVLDLLRETENTFTANQVVSGNVSASRLFTDSGSAASPSIKVGNAENGLYSDGLNVKITSNGNERATINNIGMMLTNSVTNNSTKNTRYCGYHYTNSEEPTGGLIINSSSGLNAVLIGGGSSAVNAATSVNVYVASNSTTLTGTNIATFNTSGLSVNGSGAFSGNVFLTGASDPTIRLAENNSSTSYSEIIDATAAFCRFRKIAASGISTILVDPQVTDGSSASSVSFFRETNTTGDAGLVIFRGNNSADINSRLRSYGDSFLNALTGNVAIGTSTPTEKLTVVGSGTFSDNLIVSKHIDVANRGLSGIGTDGNGIYIRDGSNVKQLTLYRATSGSLIIDGQGSSVFLPLKQSESAFNVQDNSFNTLFSVSIAGVAIGGTTPTAKLDISSNTIRLRTAKTPASATATGNAGDICWDADYVYVCTATNTWKRSALSTW